MIEYGDIWNDFVFKSSNWDYFTFYQVFTIYVCTQWLRRTGSCLKILTSDDFKMVCEFIFDRRWHIAISRNPILNVKYNVCRICILSCGYEIDSIRIYRQGYKFENFQNFPAWSIAGYWLIISITGYIGFWQIYQLNKKVKRYSNQIRVNQMV